MPSNHLTAYVDAWTVQAVMASRWLTRLYRALRDDRQAAMAGQVGAPAEKRLSRLGLQDQVTSLEERFGQDYPEETQAEEAAWAALVESLAGLSAFFASTNGSDGEPAPGLRGPRTVTNAALRKSIRGFHTAFPDEIVNQGMTLVISKVTATGVDAFMADIEEKDPERLDQLGAGVETCFREALENALLAEV